MLIFWVVHRILGTLYRIVGKILHLVGKKSNFGLSFKLVLKRSIEGKPVGKNYLVQIEL